MESPIPSKMFEDLSDFSRIQTNLHESLFLARTEFARLMAIFIVFSFYLVCHSRRGDSKHTAEEKTKYKNETRKTPTKY